MEGVHNLVLQSKHIIGAQLLYYYTVIWLINKHFTSCTSSITTNTCILYEQHG